MRRLEGIEGRSYGKIREKMGGDMAREAGDMAGEGGGYERGRG